MNERAAGAPKKGRVDFLNGPPWKQILLFALPLMLSSVLQQMYNTVASIIVGKGVSHVALAAVGISGTYTRVLTSMFMGIAMGGNVLIAQYYGARDKEGLSKATHSAIFLSVSAGIVLSTIGIIMTPTFLRWAGTPDDVFPLAQTYMRIVFSGITFQMTYNMLASFLRGMGDSRTQLYVLMITSVVNAALCWLFVIVFEMGVAGSGLANVISQILSVVIIFFLLQKNDWTRISLKKIRLHKLQTLDLLRIGVPTAVQQVIMSLTGTIVMGNITPHGTAAIAGNSVGNTLDMYVGMPVSSLNMTVTPFAAQNIGGNRMDRVRLAAKQVVAMNLGISIVFVSTILIFSRTFLGIFTDDAATIAAGIIMVRIVTPTHLMGAIAQPLSGVIRGSGEPMVPAINALITSVIVRIPLIYLLNPIFDSVQAVYFSLVGSTFVGLVYILIVYFRGKWAEKAMNRSKTLAEQAERENK